MKRNTAKVAGLVLTMIFQRCATADVPLSPTGDGHLSIPVTLNGQGPFDFTIDTAAQRPMIAPPLARKLHIEPTGNSKFHGSSGTQSADFAQVSDFRSGLFDRQHETIVIVPPGGGVSVGVVGMDSFLDKRIELDFSHMTASVDSSSATPAGFTAIPAVIRAGTMVIVDVTVNGFPAKALIDSGARRTIANPALQAALGYQNGDPSLAAADAVGGATGDKVPASKGELKTIALGPATFDKPLVTFADLPVFAPLGLADTPALILGLDQLAHLKAMAIDFPRAEFQIKP